MSVGERHVIVGTLRRSHGILTRAQAEYLRQKKLGPEWSLKANGHPTNQDKKGTDDA